MFKGPRLRREFSFNPQKRGRRAPFPAFLSMPRPSWPQVIIDTIIGTRLVRRIHGRTRGNIYSSAWDTALYGQVPRWWTQSFQGSRRTRRCSQTPPAWRTCTCSASRTRRCMAKCPVGGRKAFRARVEHGAVVKPLRHGARVRVLHRGRGAEWRSNRC